MHLSLEPGGVNKISLLVHPCLYRLYKVSLSMPVISDQIVNGNICH